MKNLPSLFLFCVTLISSCIPEENQHDDAIYKEAYRPQIHFSPPENWMNDPNGLVYYEGEYHLFYQYYPDSTVWGPMHWGHAVSTNLVHWENLPIALYPDTLGLIFSGSCVIDTDNTTGFGSTDNPAMVAIFSYHSVEKEQAGGSEYQYQGIAYSTDKGRTWTKYEGNPVLPNTTQRDFRDPKVFWHTPSSRWIMSLAVLDHIAFYASPNLVDWTFLSDFGYTIGNTEGVWECPDLIYLPVEGSDSGRWTLLVSINPGAPQGGSATQYFTGTFDGTVFTPDDSVTRWIDHGKDNYAGVTFSNLPDNQNRTVFLGWMSNWQYAQVVPTIKWRSAMTLPRTLSLFPSDNGLVIGSEPIHELSSLHKSGAIRHNNLTTGHAPINLPDGPLEIQLEAAWETDTLKITLENTADEFLEIGITAHSVYVDRSHAGENAFSEHFAGRHGGIRALPDQRVSARLFIDASSIELFLDEGTTVVTETFFPSAPYHTLTYNLNGAVESSNIISLKSIWHDGK